MRYNINGVEYESWSANNQRVIDRLVSREVYCCMTAEIEYMLSRVFESDEQNPFTEDDLLPMYRKACSECGSTDGFTEVEISKLTDDELHMVHGFCEDTGENGDGYECPVCGLIYSTAQQARACCDFEDSVWLCDCCGHLFSDSAYQELGEEPAEVYEWWAVSNWFGEKLKARGCVVLESWGKSYWGRETTGQAIALDTCVADIAREMGILEGMEHYEYWK